jgi:uncharacterized protein (TIGR03435 family)
LDGQYSLELQYSVQLSGGRIIQTDKGPIELPAMTVTMSAIPPNDNWLALSAALRQQLGLRLEPVTVQEDVFVIDRISLPSYDTP